MPEPETEYDFDVLAIRRRMGRDLWHPPRVGPGPSGVTFVNVGSTRSVIITSAEWQEDYDAEVTWLHASIAVHPDGDEVPTYEELTKLRQAVWGDTGWAFQVFAPPSAHVNIRRNALHLWGRLDGLRIHPDFGAHGSI